MFCRVNSNKNVKMDFQRSFLCMCMILKTIFRVPQCEAGFLSLNYHTVWALAVFLLVSDQQKLSRIQPERESACGGGRQASGVLCMPQAPASPMQIWRFEGRAPL